ncbi:MAG TPA: transcriptional repressor [Patescibacteria group bacterium]
MNNSQHDCKNELQNVSLQVTPARIAAMQLFESHDSPLDAQYLINHLHNELGIDRVTVFRILNTFVEKGLIRKLEFGEGKARYELNNKEHHHLICKSCGSIEDISDCNISSLEKDIKKKKGFLVQQHSLEFFGICKNCQK